MAPRTVHRSPEVENIVRQQRAKMTPEQLHGIPMPADYSVSTEYKTWVAEVTASGELREALDAIGREDQDLAT